MWQTEIPPYLLDCRDRAHGIQGFHKNLRSVLAQFSLETLIEQDRG